MDNNQNRKKYLEFLEFVNSGKVKLFTEDDFKEMEVIRDEYSSGINVIDRVDKFISSHSK